MIINAPRQPAATVTRVCREEPDHVAYFDPHLRVVSAAALDCDARPANALDQIFGYFWP